MMDELKAKIIQFLQDAREHRLNFAELEARISGPYNVLDKAVGELVNEGVIVKKYSGIELVLIPKTV